MKSSQNTIDKIFNDFKCYSDELYRAAIISNTEMAKALTESSNTVIKISNILTKILEQNDELKDKLRKTKKEE